MLNNWFNLIHYFVVVFFSIVVEPALRVLFAIFQLPVTPKKSCKDRCEPRAIVVSDGMVRKIFLIWHKSFVTIKMVPTINKCFKVANYSFHYYQSLSVAYIG